MKLFDAINASPVEAAWRYLTDHHILHQPNIVLIDKEKPKAFRADGPHAWDRRTLALAKCFEDWRPAQTRGAPELHAPDIVTRLGDVV